MLRFFLFMAAVMAASTSTAGDASPCPADTVPVQIMTPGSSASPHFHAFITAVTEHVAARLARDKLCMDSADSKNRFRLQFVYWNLDMTPGFPVPEPPFGAFLPDSCWISSPWIDLVLERRPVPSVRGVVRWNERQFLADQAVLAGAKNVPPGIAMPLKRGESGLGHFAWEYEDTETPPRPAAKPIEERVPPDLLWLFRRSGGEPFLASVAYVMHKATEKGAEGYTKLVLALIDRCFASDEAILHYDSILDVADPILFKQYRIVGKPLPNGRERLR
jgi:hypothetical protein